MAAMKHIAYVFDALIYYMRSGTDAAAAVSVKDGNCVEQLGWAARESEPQIFIRRGCIVDRVQGDWAYIIRYHDRKG